VSQSAANGSPALLWHTVRHLRPRQLTAQLWLRSAARLRDPRRLARRPAPGFPGCCWRLAHEPLAPGAQTNTAEDLLGGRITFINAPRETDWPPDWDCPELPLLWRYNLHYFEWLWALRFDDARRVVDDWITRHVADRRSVGWAPYPLSLRLQNWLALFFGRWRRQTEDDRAWTERLWSSVWLQAEWLSHNLEYHLMANHLLENAIALTWAGACFDGADARRWFGVGFELLGRELDEQILPDGMHYERSPMYHLRATYVTLLLGCLDRGDVRQRVVPVLQRMSPALRCLMHPDEQIALFNDSAFGIVNEPVPLLAAADEISGGSTAAVSSSDGAWALPDSGYFGFRDRSIYLICDAGPIGPDYMTGHAHGDLLSFELSVGGQRMLVDSGVYSYEGDTMRRYCRSTRAHNTVEIEGQDQCEFWGVFRVARRARPLDVVWQPGTQGFDLTASHDGYRRLAGRPIHRRQLTYRTGGMLEVVDRVDAARPVRTVSRLHLHPDCRVERQDQNSAEIVCRGRRLRLVYSGTPGTLTREESWYLPEFGRRVSNICLARSSRGASIDGRLQIEIG
jgi:uncharacterized heparinase superfamily protein